LLRRGVERVERLAGKTCAGLPGNGRDSRRELDVELPGGSALVVVGFPGLLDAAEAEGEVERDLE